MTMGMVPAVRRAAITLAVEFITGMSGFSATNSERASSARPLTAGLCRHEEVCRSFDGTQLARKKDERICYLYAAYNNGLTVDLNNLLNSIEKELRLEIPLSPCDRGSRSWCAGWHRRLSTSWTRRTTRPARNPSTSARSRRGRWRTETWGTRTMTNSEIQDRTCVRPSFRSRGCSRAGQPRLPVGERRSWRLRAGPKAASHASDQARR